MTLKNNNITSNSTIKKKSWVRNLLGKISLFTIIFLFFSALSFSQVKKQNKTLSRILFIMDASNSMTNKFEKTNRMDASKKLLSNMLDSLSRIDNVQVAFRVFGSQSLAPPYGSQDCNDTKLEVPFSRDNVPLIKQKLFSLQPKGTTLIAQSLLQAATDFPESNVGRNIIILITDGIEECSGDPCAVSWELQKKGIVLKPFVIGVGLDVKFRSQFECMGSYYDANTEKQFSEVLSVVISQALNSTTAQVNLLDVANQPTETDVAFTLFDNLSGNIKYNFIHTLNHRGNPDTIELDPLVKYKLMVHSIPPVYVDSISLVPGKHNIIAADCPQGNLSFKMDMYNQTKPINAIIRKKGEMQTLNIQEINKTEKYIVGKYDLEILTLPRLLINDVDLKQSYTTTIEIPKLGVIKFTMPTTGYGSIFLEKDNNLEWVCNLSQNTGSETLSLLPGKYKVIYRSKNIKITAASIDKSFKVISGITSTIILK
ncbi:MAG: hypothetical protein A2275_12140 [Bacteroidetes bacterium RIFOXYA12_FULL_35_11]|nr:MAG: hypothetical protein A2X01_14275 [Bacteroidetes bacterium GWF2_35_48]OFY78521.1 MAG: hypothetical protein A2275_12140 [Bacteroidetes bacterium RIFOXYA12_FULL_35_11]OFZ01655.1 MAG: hypothetical protein A2491_12905 [Bacteroidetes bacterium RIFOXYC12_FULL_35_7]HBX52249.1 von willebrand factor type a [Bacteroidales bacterium]